MSDTTTNSTLVSFEDSSTTKDAIPLCYIVVLMFNVWYGPNIFVYMVLKLFKSTILRAELIQKTSYKLSNSTRSPVSEKTWVWFGTYCCGKVLFSVSQVLVRLVRYCSFAFMCIPHLIHSTKLPSVKVSSLEAQKSALRKLKNLGINIAFPKPTKRAHTV